jgi:hypothetical protein
LTVCEVSNKISNAQVILRNVYSEQQVKKIFAIVVPILAALYYIVVISKNRDEVGPIINEVLGKNLVSPCVEGKLILPAANNFQLKFIAVEDGAVVRSILQNARVNRSKNHNEEIMDAVRAGTARRFAGSELLMLRIRGLASANQSGNVPYFFGEDICKGMIAVTLTSDSGLTAKIPISGVQLAQAGIVLPRSLFEFSSRAQLCYTPTFKLAYPTDRNQNAWCEAEIETSAGDIALRGALRQGKSSATYLVISGPV